MFIIKILGMVSFIIGCFMLFSTWFIKDTEYNKFGLRILFSPLLIYLGIYSMKIF